MKFFLVLASLVMLVRAQHPLEHGYGGYDAPYGAPGPAYGPGPSIGAPQLGYHQAPIIHKHVYVHVPPPEPYLPKIKKVHPPLPPPQKHYKIIFIKAPTPPPVELPDVPLIPPAPEVKTLVYVLTKKPEPLPELNIPVPPPPAQHKPEVFFIRYKTPGGDLGFDAAQRVGQADPFIETGNQSQEQDQGFIDQGKVGGHGTDYS